MADAAQIAELFQTTPQNVSLHLRAVFTEGELVEAATCKDYFKFDPKAGARSPEADAVADPGPQRVHSFP